MEAVKIIVACSAMAILKQKAKEEEQAPKIMWTKWKHGGIIGVAAITGGTLMAINGAPTLGTIVRVIRAGRGAAVGTAGSNASSVASLPHLENFVAAATTAAGQDQDAPPLAQGYNLYSDHAPAYPSEQPPAAHANSRCIRKSVGVTVA
ncbi:transmembrane and coiled-coil domain-containing protein 4-like protein [Tanacetum coccineum]